MLEQYCSYLKQCNNVFLLTFFFFSLPLIFTLEVARISHFLTADKKKYFNAVLPTKNVSLVFVFDLSL